MRAPLPQELVQKYIKKDDSILMAGCGNSRLSEDMFEDGYANLSNIDISRVARLPRPRPLRSAPLRRSKDERSAAFVAAAAQLTPARPRRSSTR